ncbi:lytic transglycosylase domain-containing protein [Patescibacteria group bacterium]|nr:lytic transglycosylase domain-containing protein [Patescibacteria group bacterium]
MKLQKEFVTETTERARSRVTPWHFLLVFLLVLLAGRLFRPASAARATGDDCPNAREPWSQTGRVYALLEDGRQIYLNCGEISEVESGPFDSVSLEEEVCFLSETISGWSPKLQAKWYEVRQHCSSINRYASMYDIDVDLVAAVMMQESGGWSGAESVAGAQGAMQVMPFHYCSSWDPVENIDCGVKILAGHVNRDGVEAGLAAYNAGVRGRDEFGNGWDFSRAVLAIYTKIQ